jgi:hypothetical protein
MFPRSYNSFDSGPKSPLAKPWPKSPKSNVNPIGITKSLKLQNPSFSFAICEVLPKILNVIDVDPNEVLLKIPNFITLDLDEIVELSNSQSSPQAHPPGKKQKLGVGGIGKKPSKKSYDNNKRFQAK